MSQYQSLGQLQKAFPGAKTWEYKAFKKHPRIYIAWKKSPLHKGEHQEKQFMKFYHDHVNIHPDNPEAWVQWRKLNPLENRSNNIKDEQSLHQYTIEYKLGEKEKIEHPGVYQNWVKGNPKNPKDLSAFHKFYTLYAASQDVEFDKFFKNLDMNGTIDNISDFRKRYPNAADWEYKAYKKNPERYRKWKSLNPNGSRESYKQFKSALSKKDVMNAMIASSLPNLTGKTTTLKNYATFEEFTSDFPGAKTWEYKAYKKHPRIFMVWKSENPIQHQEKHFLKFYHAHESEIIEEPVNNQMIIDTQAVKRDRQSNFKKNALRLRNRYFSTSEPEPPHYMTTTHRPILDLVKEDRQGLINVLPDEVYDVVDEERRDAIHNGVKLNKIGKYTSNAAITHLNHQKLEQLRNSEMVKNIFQKLAREHKHSKKEARGIIKGIEADGVVYNSEKDMYVRALKALGNDFDVPQPLRKIRATRDVHSAVQNSVPGFSNRLSPWK